MTFTRSYQTVDFQVLRNLNVLVTRQINICHNPEVFIILSVGSHLIDKLLCICNVMVERVLVLKGSCQYLYRPSARFLQRHSYLIAVQI